MARIKEAKKIKVINYFVSDSTGKIFKQSELSHDQMMINVDYMLTNWYEGRGYKKVEQKKIAAE